MRPIFAPDMRRVPFGRAQTRFSAQSALDSQAACNTSGSTSLCTLWFAEVGCVARVAAGLQLHVLGARILEASISPLCPLLLHLSLPPKVTHTRSLPGFDNNTGSINTCILYVSVETRIIKIYFPELMYNRPK